MEIDTGQVDERSEILSENDHMEEKEVNKSDKSSDNNTSFKKARCKGMLLEMEFRRKQGHEDANEVDQMKIECTICLINKWVESKSIEGINTHDGMAKKDDFNDVEKWVHSIKIVERKDSISTNMMLQACTSFSTCRLCQDAKETCQKYQIRVVSKETAM